MRSPLCLLGMHAWTGTVDYRPRGVVLVLVCARPGCGRRTMEAYDWEGNLVARVRRLRSHGSLEREVEP